MIDKLEVRVPCDTPYHPEFGRLYADLHYDSSKSPFHRTRHYEVVGDLRPYGYNVIIHMHCRWGKHGHHKIELVDTGQMTYAGMMNEIERIFQVNPLPLAIMRLDLAVDVRGIPVSWFQERLRARYKQVKAVIGFSDLVQMGKGEFQTLYFGRRPNLFRIYDKVAEYISQYRKLIRNATKPIPSFKEIFGIPDTGYVLTRVERQMGGGKIPERLATVGDLRNAAEYRPFGSLAIIDGGISVPSPDDYSFETYLAGMQLRHMAETQGMQGVMRHIKKYSKGNSKWALEKFRDFLPIGNANEMINTDYLYELYRASTMRQLAA